jgi:transposase-like protein
MSTGPSASLPVKLTQAERSALNQWSQGINAAPALARRSRIILECAKGSSDAAAARALDVHPQTVKKWRARFHEKGIDGLTASRPDTQTRPVGDEVKESAAKQDDVSFGKKELRAAILESRATAAGAMVALAALLAGLFQFSNQQNSEEMKENRRYVDKVTWWDGYEQDGSVVHFANRSTAKLSSLLLRNQAPGDGGFIIDMGTVAPCTEVTVKIARSVFPAHLPDGREPIHLWQTGDITFWDPVGFWATRGGVTNLEVMRSETETEPTDRFGGLEESFFINTSELDDSEIDLKKIFTNVPKTAEPANDCS